MDQNSETNHHFLKNLSDLSKNYLDKRADQKGNKKIIQGRGLRTGEKLNGLCRLDDISKDAQLTIYIMKTERGWVNTVNSYSI